jgi:hypothetical protein
LLSQIIQVPGYLDIIVRHAIILCEVSNYNLFRNISVIL